jgi:hypothetical protein
MPARVCSGAGAAATAAWVVAASSATTQSNTAPMNSADAYRMGSATSSGTMRNIMTGTPLPAGPTPPTTKCAAARIRSYSAADQNRPAAGMTSLRAGARRAAEVAHRGERGETPVGVSPALDKLGYPMLSSDSLT